MLPINIALAYEQEKRKKQDRDAINEEANRNANLHSEGKFDGVCGLEPSLPHGQLTVARQPRHPCPQEHSYWSGYCVGLREYWAKKLNVEIPTEF